jgi:hypothetical protein
LPVPSRKSEVTDDLKSLFYDDWWLMIDDVIIHGAFSSIPLKEAL